jgi:hypothetical protein
MTCSQRARCSTFRFDLYTFLHDSRMHGVISPQQGLLDGVRADLDSGHGVAGLLTHEKKRTFIARATAACSTTTAMMSRRTALLSPWMSAEVSTVRLTDAKTG